MDAGLAAVIAGAAGAGGAALAAFGTSLGLLKQAKTQGDHAHRQWLRTHQQEAYGEMLSALEGLEQASRDALVAAQFELHVRSPGDDPVPPLDVAPSERVKAQARLLKAATQKVILLSNPDVGERARDGAQATLMLSEHVIGLVWEMSISGSAPAALDRWDQLADEASRASGKFIAAARASLQAR